MRQHHIGVDVDGTPGANDMPGRIEFHTTSDGSAGATERLRITSAGLVGINVTSPTNTLHVVDSGGSTGSADFGPSANRARIYAASDGIRFGSTSNHAVIFRTNNTERLRVDTSGNQILGHTSAIASMKFGGSGDFGSHSYVGANKVANGLAILNYDATASIPAILKLATSRNDTAGSNTVVGNSGDNCASIQFMGNDGTRFIGLARIDAVSDGTVGSNDMRDAYRS